MGINRTLKSSDENQKRGVLEREIDAFMEDLPKMLRRHEDKWVVYKGDDRLKEFFGLGGFWDTKKGAGNAGRAKFGNVPMLVYQVSKEYLEYPRYGEPRHLPMYVTPVDELV